MSGWLVSIPGIAVPHPTFAVSRDAALADALDHLGLHFAPAGTTVTPLDDDMRRPAFIGVDLASGPDWTSTGEKP
jgi:hypothetical protein